jgi:hypothetical protein
MKLLKYLTGFLCLILINNSSLAVELTDGFCEEVKSTYKYTASWNDQRFKEVFGKYGYKLTDDDFNKLFGLHDKCHQNSFIQYARTDWEDSGYKSGVKKLKAIREKSIEQRYAQIQELIDILKTGEIINSSNKQKLKKNAYKIRSRHGYDSEELYKKGYLKYDPDLVYITLGDSENKLFLSKLYKTIVYFINVEDDIEKLKKHKNIYADIDLSNIQTKAFTKIIEVKQTLEQLNKDLNSFVFVEVAAAVGNDREVIYNYYDNYNQLRQDVDNSINKLPMILKAFQTKERSSLQTIIENIDSKFTNLFKNSKIEIYNDLMDGLSYELANIEVYDESNLEYLQKESTALTNTFSHYLLQYNNLIDEKNASKAFWEKVKTGVIFVVVIAGLILMGAKGLISGNLTTGKATNHKNTSSQNSPSKPLSRIIIFKSSKLCCTCQHWTGARDVSNHTSNRGVLLHGDDFNKGKWVMGKCLSEESSFGFNRISTRKRKDSCKSWEKWSALG